MTKRKLLTCLLMTVGASACALGVAACDNNHEHTYSKDWNSGENYHWHDATCKHTDEVGNKAEHVWNGGNVLAPVTHDSAGITIYTCTVCGYQKTEVTEANEDAHTYSTEWTYDKTHHWYDATCEHTDEVSGKQLHTGEWITVLAETCTTAGTQEFTCTECGYTETRTVPATGHAVSKEWTNDETVHWHEIICEHGEDLSAEYYVHNFVNGICTECGYFTGPEINFKLSEDGEEYEVVGVGAFTGNVLNIPAEYNGKPVTAIADNAFQGSNLEGIVIPYGVKTIGKNAFYDCTALKSISLPDTVLSIGSYAFYNCNKLGNIVIPFGVTEIADGAFYKCTSLSNAVILGSNVTKIGNAAFAWCSSLSNINIPYSVRSIGESAFSECTALTGIKMSDSLTKIGKGAFFNCTALSKVVLPKGLTAIESNLFNYCTSLSQVTIPDGVTKIGSFAFSECSSLSAIIIPENVTEIGEAAFANCGALATVTVYDKIATVRDYAFNGCENISTLCMPTPSKVLSYIPKTVLETIEITSGTKIENSMFTDCTALKNLVIADSVTSIGENAFDGLENIQSVAMPALAIAYVPKTNLKTVIITSGSSIADDAFRNCTTLTAVGIAESVTSIGDDAFYGCVNIQSAAIPAFAISYIPQKNLQSVEIISGSSIARNAFRNCATLKEVAIADSITSIGEDAFYNCSSLTGVYIADLAAWCNIYFYNNYSNPLYYAHSLYLNGKLVSNLEIPEEVTSIGQYAFYNETTFRSVTIPDSLTEIGKDAFYGCTSLSKVNITDLSAWCNIEFYNSDANPLKSAAYLYLEDNLVKDLVIPNGVKNISEYAFYNCTPLTSVTIHANVNSIGEDAFYNCTSLTKVNITDLSAWCNIEFSNSDANPLSYAKNLYYYDSLVEELAIPYGVTGISNYAFYNCKPLTSVTIPDSVTSIWDNAFYGCTNIRTATMPASAIFYIPKDKLETVVITSGISIYSEAFNNCTSLMSITIPASVTSIGYNAFYGCTSLNEVYITDLAKWCNTSFYNVYSNPLSYANNLYLNDNLVEELVIPEEVTEISAYAFYNCKSLTSVEIPASVTSIGDNAFYGCTNIQTAKIPASAISYIPKNNLNTVVITSGTSIGYEAFEYCTSLTSITIPDSVTSIGSDAFYGCTNIQTAKIPASAISYIPNRNLKTVEITSGTSIPSEAFRNCYYLKNVTLPDSITSVGNNAFDGCNNLDYTTYDYVQYLGSVENPYLVLVKVSSTSRSSYEINGNTKIICNNAFYNCSYMSSITIPDSVISIGENAFYGCEYIQNAKLPASMLSYITKTNLRTVEITSGDSIPYNAFSGCSRLTSVTIPDSVTTISSYAFENCKSLTSIEIPASVTSIGSDAFAYCQSLNEIYISDLEAWCKISFFGDNAANPLNNSAKLYLDGSLVEELVIPEGITEIYPRAFVGCNSLISVTIPEGVTSIGSYAFNNCISLSSVTIAEGVTLIGGNAFYNCKALTSVIIPLSVTLIEDGAFYNCTSLTHIYYAGDAEKWNEIPNDYYLPSDKVYFYSEDEPALNEEGTDYDGKYWYEVEGEIVIWTKEKEVI